MTNKIALQFSGGNLSFETYEEIAQRVLALPVQAEIYHLEPPKEEDLPPLGEFESPAVRSLRRRRTYAAFDWTIVSHIADIVGIASFLWLIYETLIRPHRQDSQVEQGLFISIDPEKGLSWFLGKDFDDREVFINDFEAKVSRYQQTTEAGEKYEAITTEIRLSGMWIRKK